MSKIRTFTRVAALAAVLLISASAVAAPRHDDIGFGSFTSRLRLIVVTILDDIRGTFPPG